MWYLVTVKVNLSEMTVRERDAYVPDGDTTGKVGIGPGGYTSGSWHTTVKAENLRQAVDKGLDRIQEFRLKEAADEAAKEL